MSVDKEKIKKEGVKLLDKFSQKLEKIPEVNETHYVLDLKNITRKDNKGEKKNFKKKMKKNAPKWEEGYLVAEEGV